MKRKQKDNDSKLAVVVLVLNLVNAVLVLADKLISWFAK